MSEVKDTVKSFTDLIAWREGHKLVLSIYKTTSNFPNIERFGLTNQLRRAAVSVTSNLAEGFGRNSYKERMQFYAVSLSSLYEVQNQLLIARDTGFINPDRFSKLIELTTVVSKLINGLLKKTKLIILDS